MKLNPAELEGIEDALKCEERHNLAMATINSKDENVMMILDEAMMVANIIHGEEIATQKIKRRKYLIEKANERNY